MIAGLICAAGLLLSQEGGATTPSFQEHVREAAAQFQQSGQSAKDQLQFWNTLVGESGHIPPTRADLSMVRKSVLDNNIAHWLTVLHGSMKHLPLELGFLEDSILIWCLFEADLFCHPDRAPLGLRSKLTSDSRPVHYSAKLAVAIRQQAMGNADVAAEAAREVYDSNLAPPQLRELAGIVLNAADSTRALPNEPIAAAIEGKFTVILFLTNHPSSQKVRSMVHSMGEAFERTELEIHDVVLAQEPSRVEEAELFGCHLLPLAILVGPNRIPISRWPSSEWPIYGYGSLNMKRHPWSSRIWGELGGTELAELQKLEPESSWFEFRDSWRSLRRGNAKVYSPNILSRRARYLEKPFLGMLLLAAESKKPPQVQLIRSPEEIHERMVLAWYRDRSNKSGVWEHFLEEATRKVSRQPALDIADALLDLGITSDESAQVLIRLASKSRDWRTQSSALRALEFQETTESPKQLSRHARSRVWQIRLALAEGMRGFHNKEAIPILIGLLEDDRQRIRASAAISLRKLTGAPYGPSTKDWSDWWDEVEDDFSFPAFGSRRAGGVEPGKEGFQTASYYGLGFNSDRILFLIDKSESMMRYGKWLGLLEELNGFLGFSADTLHFNIVEFSDQVDLWEDGLQQLDQRSQKDAMRFLQRTNPYGPTNLSHAIEIAFEDTDADTVVLLSDGRANRGDAQQPDEILSQLRRLNRYTRLTVHTVYLVGGPRLPYLAGHHCTGGCPAPSEADPEGWKLRMRDQLPRTKHGEMLARMAADNGGVCTIGFGKPWHSRPP